MKNGGGLGVLYEKCAIGVYEKCGTVVLYEKYGTVVLYEKFGTVRLAGGGRRHMEDRRGTGVFEQRRFRGLIGA